MKIVAIKPSHDGSVVLLEDQRLVLSWEGEKGSHQRHSALPAEMLIEALEQMPRPDIIAISGWHGVGAGYSGTDKGIMRTGKILGAEVKIFSSSHERSHIACALGMSPYPRQKSCYVLVWEGTLGRFYEASDTMSIKQIGEPLFAPGIRYAYMYYLAHPHERNFSLGPHHHTMPGKVMALAGLADGNDISDSEKQYAEYLLDAKVADLSVLKKHLGTNKDTATASPIQDIGIDNPRFHRFAKYVSDKIFTIFHSFAKKNIIDRRPLLITGGCGLNCEWNTRWVESDIFSNVFIPPCPNDSGSAIGTAIDAQIQMLGEAKIEWTPYSGPNWVRDCTQRMGWYVEALDINRLVKLLASDTVIFWAQGRAEIGPRALGNRSILAAPFHGAMRNELNRIKQREWYRPVAPICPFEVVRDYFEGATEDSPYMLHFWRVKSERLGAVTHYDRSARVQTLKQDENPFVHKLLVEFGRYTGVPILCNTSLNWPGRGFINRATEALSFAEQAGVNVVIEDGRMWQRHRTQVP